MSSTGKSPSQIDEEPMIRLEALTKRYRGQAEPAVDDVNLDIPKGEIVVFVGPSGCGKTTTLKMINRIIEPTSGRIFLEGDDVTKVDPDQLRRRIGYVIQQIGLFPHMTIAANIGMVPKLLGWERRRVADRVDELLDLVGMEPGEYRSRYPKELSGGQRQRVGVARAMGADPPVMLMDEPFGAVDPITRERLQNELLRLQAEIRKTIILVTHDIDEAIKMGDRIAILKKGARLAQYDPPETILVDPADRFVEDFIGSGASLKRLQLTRVNEVRLAQWPLVGAGAQGRNGLRGPEPGGLDGTHPEAAAGGDQRFALIVDEQRRPVRWVDRWVERRNPAQSVGSDRTASSDRNDGMPAPPDIGWEPTPGRDAAPLGREASSAIHGRTEFGGSGLPVTTVRSDRTLRDALNEMLGSRVGGVAVVDETGSHLGVVDLPTIMTAVQGMRRGAGVEAAT